MGLIKYVISFGLIDFVYVRYHYYIVGQLSLLDGTVYPIGTLLIILHIHKRTECLDECNAYSLQLRCSRLSEAELYLETWNACVLN